MANEDWVSPDELVCREMNSMRARLLTAIESAALPEGQEIALKTLIKNMSYQSQRVFQELVNTLDDADRLFRYGPSLETR
jgi:hypothetical protein